MGGGHGPRFAQLDTDYTTWAAYCRAYLKTRKLWKVVAEDRPACGSDKPSPEAMAWDEKNEEALGLIQMCVKPQLLSRVVECTTAAEAWNTLKAIFEADTTSRQMDLMYELSTLKMEPGETVIKYVGRAKGLQLHLATARQAVDEHTMVLHVLKGLPEQYAMLRTVLTNTGSKLDLESTTAKLMLQEKEVKGNSRSGALETTQALAVATTYSGRGTRDKGDWKRKAKCYYCQRMGHIQRDCHKKKADEARRGVPPGGRRRPQNGGGGGARAFTTTGTSGQEACGRATADGSWVVDSGATHHMTTGSDGYEPAKFGCGRQVTVASGAKVGVTSSGRATVQARGPDGKTTVTLDDTLCVPGLQSNLLSVSTVDRRGGAVIFADGKCHLLASAADVVKSGVLRKSAVRGHLTERCHYVVGGHKPGAMANVASSPVTGVAQLMHRRFMHLGYKNLERVAGMVNGLSAEDVKAVRVAGAVCPPCAEAKLTHSPIKSTTSTTKPMELLHSDVCGPLEETYGGSRYFMTVVDDKSGLKVAVPIKRKSDVGAVLISKIRLLERLSGKKAKRVRTDGAKEYATPEVKNFLRRVGHPARAD